jgi:hypothetical protein
VDVSGTSQAVHPVPLPRSRTPAESTIPRLFVGLIDAAPASRTAKASACQLFRGSITRLQHLLPTLQEWCCHHPCKARFRLAGLPLPGGSRTLWIALKGFRSHFHSPFLDFSWRYRDELPPPHSSSHVRGELAVGARGTRAATLYPVGRSDPNHDARMRIGGEAPRRWTHS